MGRHRRCRVHRRGHRASAHHRPRQGRGRDGRWCDVRAEICREQTQVLSEHLGGCGVRCRAGPLLCLHQYRPHGGRQLG
ncbi:hypothetical protein [Marivita sp.]|uniref:hypothetical protein n=1 Tax=Marivita sp. TaxID=2003365 RepID=UPI00345A183A